MVVDGERVRVVEQGKGREMGISLLTRSGESCKLDSYFETRWQTKKISRELCSKEIFLPKGTAHTWQQLHLGKGY
ncbi:MAG: hypothetical protein A2542_03080 [Parcubacteria group bacterium RIFOXYD2_FULL_52_8]|nr:MAG: hypothetical protein A2542_03080 [Parcubacteria group bacterium RIFOXYD2_FULL_52_8]